MQYLCLVHMDSAAMAALPEDERAALDRRAVAFNAELARQGQLVAAAAIEEAACGVILRVRDSAISSSDGPFIETKEQMAGFLLIDARDLNEALRIAAATPMAAYGALEVRAVRPIPTPP